MINDSLFLLPTFVKKLYASTASFSLERQILLWILLFSGLTFLVGAYNNFLLQLPSVYIPLAVGIVCLLLYGVARVSAVWATKLTVTPFFAYLIVATDSWFACAGIAGSVPIFLTCPILTAMILLHGRRRFYMLVSLLLHLTLLTIIQQYYPHSVRPYATLAVKQADMLTSLGMVAFYSLGYVTIVIHHLAQRRQQAEQLLLNILPLPVAEKLKYQYTGKQTIADSFTASIMFVDIVNFTELSSTMQPGELVAFLNELFSHFDMLAQAYGVEKIKTIGDCYMVAAGVPYPRPDHAHVLVRMALTIQAHIRRQNFQGYKPTFRIGINTGPVVAGIIGRQKFIYDLWGDAVNVASRMESQGTAGAIQITQRLYQLISDEFVCINQGLIDVKGKGPMAVWHVVGVRPTDPTSRTLPECTPITPPLYREAYGNSAIR